MFQAINFLLKYMNITYLQQILQNKITMLNNAKIQAFSNGDLELISSIEKELLESQNTFAQLTMLAEMELAAKNANTTASEIISSGIDSINTVPVVVVGPSASAIVNGYDISAYATDPSHEQKIQNLVNLMPTMTSNIDVDNYIQSVAVGSLVTGDMVITSAEKYKVDMPLLLAIMQNDSQFGTTGIGARTNNPGNVGNTGYAEQSYPSWQDGVEAVANWLNNHRIAIPENNA